MKTKQNATLEEKNQKLHEPLCNSAAEINHDIPIVQYTTFTVVDRAVPQSTRSYQVDITTSSSFLFREQQALMMGPK